MTTILITTIITITTTIATLTIAILIFRRKHHPRVPPSRAAHSAQTSASALMGSRASTSRRAPRVATHVQALVGGGAQT